MLTAARLSEIEAHVTRLSHCPEFHPKEMKAIQYIRELLAELKRLRIPQ